MRHYSHIGCKIKIKSKKKYIIASSEFEMKLLFHAYFLNRDQGQCNLINTQTYNDRLQHWRWLICIPSFSALLATERLVLQKDVVKYVYHYAMYAYTIGNMVNRVWYIYRSFCRVIMDSILFIELPK